jgi:hypothetical protein
MMKNFALALLVLCLATTAWAADDGQTQPRLNYANLNSPNQSTDVISTTNGAGNVKGVACKFFVNEPVAVKVYINGGSAQTFNVDTAWAPKDSDGNWTTGMIPYNLRFTSSIRVQIQRGAGGYGDTTCAVSWALD